MVHVWVYFKFCSIGGAPLLAEMMTDMVCTHGSAICTFDYDSKK